MTTRDNATACARCVPGGAGLCADHLRKRRVMIRNSAARLRALITHRDHIIALASAETDVPDCDDLPLPVSVSLREVV
jgi:hypothetical protein